MRPRTAYAIKGYGAYDHNGAGRDLCHDKRRRDDLPSTDGSALVNQWADPRPGEGTLGLGWINGSDVTRPVTWDQGGTQGPVAVGARLYPGVAVR